MNEGAVATIQFTKFYANKLYRLEMIEESKLQVDFQVLGNTHHQRGKACKQRQLVGKPSRMDGGVAAGQEN